LWALRNMYHDPVSGSNATSYERAG
jgi:hypothetical protein